MLMFRKCIQCVRQCMVAKSPAFVSLLWCVTVELVYRQQKGGISSNSSDCALVPINVDTSSAAIT